MARDSRTPMRIILLSMHQPRVEHYPRGILVRYSGFMEIPRLRMEATSQSLTHNMNNSTRCSIGNVPIVGFLGRFMPERCVI